MADDLTIRARVSAGGERPRAGPIVLDGEALSARRSPGLAARARAVRERRGSPPRLALMAFEDAAGRAAYSARKVRACAAAGVEAVPLIVPFGGDTAAALDALGRLLEREPLDALFVEFPFPDGVDGDAVIAAMPPALDIDIMTAPRIRGFLSGEDARPPLTVEAGLLLLDGYRIDVAGRSCAVVGDDVAFTRMFAAACTRLTGTACDVVSPDAADLSARLAGAGLAVVTAGRPHFLPSSLLAGGAIAIDVGYYNPGGRGDIDPAPGIGHLHAFAAVPGGIGPMTISVLIERVIAAAEDSGPIK